MLLEDLLYNVNSITKLISVKIHASKFMIWIFILFAKF